MTVDFINNGFAKFIKLLFPYEEFNLKIKL